MKPERNHMTYTLCALDRSRGTHGRDWLRPYGNQGYTFVHEGNVLGCRVALFLLVASWRSLVWVLEQPHGSALPDLPRMQFLWSVVQEGPVYEPIFPQ